MSGVSSISVSAQKAIELYLRRQGDRELSKFVRPVKIKWPKPTDEKFKGLGQNIDIYT